MKHSRGFTLVEVMVSMVLMAFAAIFSMLVIKVVAARQAEIRNMTQYTLVTKSLKSGFNEYINSDDPVTIQSGVSFSCNIAGNKIEILVCQLQDQLNYINGVKVFSKVINFTPYVTLSSNGIYYFAGYIRIEGSGCPKDPNYPNDPFKTLCLDRLLVNQK